MKFKVIHGPNLNLLGSREPQIYGKTTLAEINQSMISHAAARDCELVILQSNHEGQIIDEIHSSKGFDGIIINPAGYGHTSVAILDAFKAMGIPSVEVHLSNIYAREEFRRHTVTGPAMIGVISGFGAHSYILGIDAQPVAGQGDTFPESEKRRNRMRIDSAKEKLFLQGKLPFLCTSLVNIRYLTGFSGSNGYLVIGEHESFLITDSRYAEYVKSLLADKVTILIQKDSPFESISSAFESTKAKNLFIDRKLAESIGSLEKGGDPIDRMRMVKDNDELSIIRKAASIADQCTVFVAETASERMTEWELSVAIENFYRSHGCRKSSFDTIVSSGAGSSMPHYTPSMTKQIEQGSPLMIDMGCLYEDYNSDLTRTFFIDSVSAEFENIYGIVLSAQMMAVDSVKAGMTTGEVDSVARDYIAHKGLGDCFGHSLGHGIGLQVHELPAVKSGGDIILETGMVITIEPGIYLPGKGGVRIEDMVCVTEEGCEVLTHYTKKLTVL